MFGSVCKMIARHATLMALVLLVAAGTPLDAQSGDRWLSIGGVQLDTTTIATNEGHFLVWRRQELPRIDAVLLFRQEIDCDGLGYRILEQITVLSDGERHQHAPASSEWQWIAPGDQAEHLYRDACRYLRDRASRGRARR